MTEVEAYRWGVYELGAPPRFWLVASFTTQAEAHGHVRQLAHSHTPGERRVVRTRMRRVVRAILSCPMCGTKSELAEHQHTCPRCGAAVDLDFFGERRTTWALVTPAPARARAAYDTEP